MKKSYLLIISGIFVSAGVVFWAVHYSADRYLSKLGNTSACEGQNVSHTITIQNNTMIPSKTYASFCDHLTIINNDNRIRVIAFGEHDYHRPYDGVEQKALSKGQSFTIELNQTGTFRVHDHLQDQAQATFTVTN